VWEDQGREESTTLLKRLREITLEDIQSYPVWQYQPEDGSSDDTCMFPVTNLPVCHLRGRVIAHHALLANGHRQWVFISNFDCESALSTAHFATLSLLIDGGWTHLARYHDADYPLNGPDMICRRLGLKAQEVFPIGYDLTAFVQGDRSMLSGAFHCRPEARLSRSELMALAISQE
jgi:hypothetical protein